MWIQIISAILSAALPLLEQALQAWLARELHKAAETLPATPASVGADPSQKADKLLLLQKVRDGLYWWNWSKKDGVDAVIAKVKMS